ncbi:aspartyl/asparaginyl beta-hydroxylase domain-containing protein [Sphingomonas bacterium]|uniref:aspartyl/asparaginyl beta-hydroxylase domain-containing protein n=1 Tax=Sphingomonas bacterium TaxID=1895847 RepID=UPI0015762D2D|nr:aspartyl/asparaginyl beta-hydroxylase domain-containing protein [Sphingomonas bacterium]
MLSNADIQTLSGQADAAAARRDLPAAAAMLAELAAYDPGDAVTWKKLAAIHRALGRSEDAMIAIGHALAIEPRDPLSLLLKAGLIEAKGDDAEEPYRAALSLIDEPDAAPPALRARLEHARRYCDTAHRSRTVRLSGIAASEIDRLGCTREECARIDAFVLGIADAVSPVLPMLSRHAYHDSATFAGLVAVARGHAALTVEYLRLLADDAMAAVPYVDHPTDVPLDQWVDLNRSRQWSAAHLWRGGGIVRGNADRCPATVEAFAALPTPVIGGRSPNLMFSILAPHTHIPPHVGVTNVRLVVHIPLIIPEDCSLTVGGERRGWMLGEAIVFDDTIEHEAVNDSDDTRVVLIGDLWHPDLSARERTVLHALMA